MGATDPDYLVVLHSWRAGPSNLSPLFGHFGALFVPICNLPDLHIYCICGVLGSFSIRCHGVGPFDPSAAFISLFLSWLTSLSLLKWGYMVTLSILLLALSGILLDTRCAICLLPLEYAH
jgi:hypothetical protein